MVKKAYPVTSASTRICGGAYQDKGINYSIRISQEMLDRIKRITQVLGPRFESLLGRKPKDSDIVRSILLKGAQQIEKEFEIGEEQEQYVLVDSLEDFEEQ